MRQGRPGTKNGFRASKRRSLYPTYGRRDRYKTWAVRLVLLGLMALLYGALVQSIWIIGLGATLLGIGCIAVFVLHRTSFKRPPMARPGLNKPRK